MSAQAQQADFKVIQRCPAKNRDAPTAIRDIFAIQASEALANDSLAIRRLTPHQDPITPEPDLHLASNGRVRSANGNGIGGVILSDHQITNPVGCWRRRRGSGLLGAHCGNIDGSDGDNCCDQSDCNEKLTFHSHTTLIQGFS